MSNTPTLFPFAHDWGDPFKVTREYLTDVQTALDGAEVRVQLRTTPAINAAMRVVFNVEQGAGKLMAAWRTAARPLLYYAPLWCDATDLTSAVTAGNTSIACDTTTRPFFAVGPDSGVGYAMLWRSVDVAEVVTFNAVASGSLTLTAGAVGSYALHGTRVVPVRPMWLSMPVKATWLSTVAFQADLAFFDQREHAAFGLADASVAAVADTISLTHRDPAPGIFLTEATVYDAGGIPIPAAVVEWSCVDGEHSDGIHVIPSINTRFALVRALTPSSTLTATSGSATVTVSAS